jgi:hypothetical protein
MSKLLSVALAAFLAGGAIAQTYGPAPAPAAGKKSEPAATTGTGTGASTSKDTGTATGTTGTTPGTAGSTSGSTRASGAASAPGLTCPPGLEMRDNDCLPPGQEKKGTGSTAPMR